MLVLCTGGEAQPKLTVDELPPDVVEHLVCRAVPLAFAANRAVYQTSHVPAVNSSDAMLVQVDVLTLVEDPSMYRIAPVPERSPFAVRID